MKRAALLAMLLVSAAGCGDHRESTANASSSGSPAPSAGTPEEAGGSPDGLRVRAERQRTGEVTISIEQHGEGRARIASALVVERQEGERWIQFEARELSLRADCATAAPRCVELVHGGALRPPPWTARSGRGQCERPTEGTAAPGGRYRIVANGCDGGARIASAPFTIPR